MLKQTKVSRQIKIFLLGVQRVSIIKHVFSYFQEVLLWLFIKFLRRYPEIQSLYVTGSMAKGNYFFGTSDMDALAFLRPLSPENEYKAVSRIFRDTARLTAFFKIPKLERIFSQQDVKFVKELSNHFFLINPNAWRLVAGDSVNLDSVMRPLPRTALSGLFFRALWAHRLLVCDYLKANSLHRECLRDFYKNTFKICHILTDMNLVAEGHDIFRNNETFIIERVDDPLLKEICKKSESIQSIDFFSKQGEEEISQACVRLFKWINAAAEKFFSMPNAEGPSSVCQNNIQMISPKQLEYAHHLNRDVAGAIAAIICFNSQLLVIAKNTATLEDLKKLLQITKKNYLTPTNDSFNPESVNFWMQDSLKAFGSHDPFWYQAYLKSAQTLVGQAPWQLMSAIQPHKELIRKLYMLNAMSEMKKGFSLRGIDLFKHQKRILNHLVVNRVLFETDIIPSMDNGKEIYQQCFAGEPETSKIVQLLERDVFQKASNLKESDEFSRDYYLCQRYLVDKLEPFVTG